MTRRGMILVAALAISACTQEASVSSPTTLLGPTTTSAPVPTTTTTTIVPGTTLPPETTVVDTTTTVPETTAAPTTAVALGEPTSVSTEYFVGGTPEAWLYLGRWTGSAWESDRDDDQQLREPLIANGDAVLAHELDAAPTAGSAGPAGEACAADGRTGPAITPNAGAPEDPGFGYRSIAFGADWPTQPRTVALVEASVESYITAGVAAFGDLDLDASSGTIQQLVVSDLDGDGDTEALVAFGADGFSALLLIDANSDASITIARSVATTVTATTVAEGDAPGEPTTTPGDTFRTLAVTDLNGDGRFEIVAHSFAGTSATVTVNTYDGTAVIPVLSASC